MNILHATTDPDLLTRLREMLGGSARADIAVGYFFISGFDAVADQFASLDKARVLVGRTDTRVLEEVALGIQQADALRSRLDADSIVRRRQRGELAQRSVAGIADGVSQLPQSNDSESAVRRLRDLIAEKRVEVRSYLKSTLHAKAYLCWYDNHPEPGSAIVGSSNFTLAGFEGNTELNVRVTGDAEMKELGRWFDDLWKDSEDISEALIDGTGQVVGARANAAVSRVPEGALRTLQRRGPRRRAAPALDRARQLSGGRRKSRARDDRGARRLLRRRRGGPGQDLRRCGATTPDSGRRIPRTGRLSSSVRRGCAPCGSA